MFATLKNIQAIFSIASCLKSSLIPLLWLKLIDWMDLRCILFLQFTKMLRMSREAVWAGSKCLIYAEVPLNIYYLLSKVGEKHVNYMDVSDSRKGKDKYSSWCSVIFINPFLKNIPHLFLDLSVTLWDAFPMARTLTCLYLPSANMKKEILQNHNSLQFIRKSKVFKTSEIFSKDYLQNIFLFLKLM